MAKRRETAPPGLPYGKYICADGREVLFDRGYAPLWQCEKGGKPTRANPGEWVSFVKQEWFYDDWTVYKRAAAEEALKKWLEEHDGNSVV